MFAIGRIVLTGSSNARKCFYVLSPCILFCFVFLETESPTVGLKPAVQLQAGLRLSSNPLTSVSRVSGLQA